MSRKIRFFSVVILFVMLMSLMFSGCDAGNVFDSGVEGLMQPPQPNEEKYRVKLLLESIAKGNVTYISPKSGYFTTPFVGYDIDGNQTEEMVVFYEEKLNGVTELYIHLFRKIGNEWVNAHRLLTRGDDVYSVDFHDLNGDEKYDEILVMWEKNDGQKTNRYLAVYECINGIISLCDTKPCENLGVIDLQPDGVMDVVTFTIERTETTSVAKAIIYQYENSKLDLMHEIPLDSGVEGFNSVTTSPEKCLFYPQYTPNNEPRLKVRYFPRVMVDCYYQGNNQLRTYVIYVEKEDEDEFENPVFSDPQKSELEETLNTRTSMISSIDINNDDVVDLPTIFEFANTFNGDPTGIPYKTTHERMIAWRTYAWYNPEYKRDWVMSEYTFSDSEFNYTVKIPEEWVQDIALEKNSSQDEYIFLKWDHENMKEKGKYASVRVFKASYWEENELTLTNMNNYKKVATNKAGTLVYAFSSGIYGMPDTLTLTVNDRNDYK